MPTQRSQRTDPLVRTRESIEDHLQDKKTDLKNESAFDQCVSLLMKAQPVVVPSSLGKAKEFERDAAERATAPLTELVQAEDKLHALAKENAADASKVAKKFIEASERYTTGDVKGLLK